jgi:hypothetical protein
MLEQLLTEAMPDEAFTGFLKIVVLIVISAFIFYLMATKDTNNEEKD